LNSREKTIQTFGWISSKNSVSREGSLPEMVFCSRRFVAKNGSRLKMALVVVLVWRWWYTSQSGFGKRCFFARDSGLPVKRFFAVQTGSMHEMFLLYHRDRFQPEMVLCQKMFLAKIVVLIRK
jgi:hypothetical protein